MELMENERPLTESEKKYIVGTIEKRNLKTAIMLYCLMLFFLSVACFVLISLGGIMSGISIFLIVSIGVFFMVRRTWNTTSELAESIKKDKVYVREAIYEGSNKYHYASFEIRKNGRRDWFCSNAYLPEIINRGEKVILIQMDEVVVWVYKARE